jgi:hypothetical protein
MQHGPCTSSDGNISRLEHFERSDRRVEQVPHFVSQKPSALIASRLFALKGELILLAAEFRHGAGDCVVEAQVQHAEIVGADCLVQFHCKLGDGLTNVAIMVRRPIR